MVPGFASHTENWGSGETAAHLLDQIIAGAADTLSGRIIHVGEDVAELAERAAPGDDVHRLRLQR